MSLLVITSNWAVCDGSLAPSRAGRVASWLEAIRRAVLRAGRGRDGRYGPVAEATIVFAGDTFDWLLSDVWAGRDRPWHGGGRAAAGRDRVAAATVRRARSALRVLRRWTRHGLMVPAGGGPASPAVRPARVTTVRPVLLAGDRDWWLPESAVVGGRLGIAIGERWFDGGREVRHGHDLDPLTHGRARSSVGFDRSPTLNESLTVDLLVPFAAAARDAPRLWPVVRPRLAALSTARPSAMPAHLEALLRGIAGRPGPVALASLWRGHVDGWHEAARRDPPSCEAEVDVLDDLAAWLGRLDPAASAPAAVRLLDEPPASSGPRVTVAHPAPAGAPMLACHPAAGAGWQERLDGHPGGPAIVAVGAGRGGDGFIDAA